MQWRREEKIRSNLVEERREEALVVRKTEMWWCLSLGFHAMVWCGGVVSEKKQFPSWNLV